VPGLGIIQFVRQELKQEADRIKFGNGLKDERYSLGLHNLRASQNVRFLFASKFYVTFTCTVAFKTACYSIAQATQVINM